MSTRVRPIRSRNYGDQTLQVVTEGGCDRIRGSYRHGRNQIECSGATVGGKGMNGCHISRHKSGVVHGVEVSWPSFTELQPNVSISGGSNGE